MPRVLNEVRRGFVDDWPILLGMFFAWGLSVALLSTIGVNGLAVSGYRSNLALYIAAVLTLVVAALLTVLWRHRPDRPLAFLLRSFGESGLASRLASGAPMLAALVLFLPIFSKMKTAIPRFNPYAWDSTWINLDRALHGTDPWRILQPAVGYPVVTALLALFYHLWILLLYLGAAYFCFFHADRALRARFFITYFACWGIIGVILATLFSSVGPCFLGPIMGDHRFDDQMAYLRRANETYPIMVLSVQEMLLEGYRTAGTGLGRGITAMPSMHVSISTLFALALGRFSRSLGVLAWIFVAVIMIGSVHLAYHYAVDGYVSIVVTWLIWKAAGPLASRMASRRPVSDPPLGATRAQRALP